MSSPSTTTMKQWITDFSEVENLRQETAPIPELEEDEVLVKINTLCSNYRDFEVCISDYDHHDSIEPRKSVVPCSDFAGPIVKVGPQSSTGHDLVEGDRVMAIFNLTHLTGQIMDEHLPSGVGLPLPGVLCEYRNFPAWTAVTGWMALNWIRPIGQPLTGSEYTVLLQGTGGVSMAGLQQAKASGLTTIVTSSSTTKLEKATSFGADRTINYKTDPNWHDEVLNLTNNKGVDIIFEQGGPQTLAKSFACVKWGGMISCIGYLSGKNDDPGDRVNTNVLALRRNVTLKGIWNGPKNRLEEVLDLYRRKRIRPVVDRVFGFEEANHAYEYLAKGVILVRLSFGFHNILGSVVM